MSHLDIHCIKDTVSSYELSIDIMFLEEVPSIQSQPYSTSQSILLIPSGDIHMKFVGSAETCAYQ